ncbi:MAG: helix-turn-helix domain-containing protein [Cyclobacteriaceae bacterium]
MGFLLETGFLEETNIALKLLDVEIAPMNDLLIELPSIKEPKRPSTSEHHCDAGDHTQRLMGMRDAMDILSGKWKIQIIAVLLFKGKMRFMDLLRVVDGIGAKMLSKELQDLETNQLITRTVCNTKPITVEYEITAYGHTLKKIVIEIVGWGIEHRKKIMTGN